MKRLTISLAALTLILAAITTALPTTGQDNTPQRLDSLETRVAILETAVQGQPSDPVAEADTFTLTGTLTLQGASETILTSDEICTGRGEFDDIQGGVDVTVTDGKGEIIAVGSLEEGVTTPYPLRCVFAFTVAEIPERPIYSIEVGHRGELTYTFADLEAAGWTLDFSLG